MTTDQERRYGAIVAAALKLSPSAIYDLRRQVIHAYGAQWWEGYPEGQIAAFVVRVLREVAGESELHGWHGVPWEEPNHELPPDSQEEVART